MFKMAAMWACVISLNSQKILPVLFKKIKLALYLQNK
jgi:hypothetical protein